MKARRLFAGVAVEAPAGLRGMMAGLKDALRAERIRWVRLENWHLTIEFFGETEAGRIPELEQALAQAAAGARVFTMKIGGLGVFGGARHPRVLWLGVESEGLEALHDRVAAALREAGWVPEARAFAPHLTLGRIERLKDARKFSETVERQRGGDAQEQLVRELILYESVSGRYVPLGIWPLGSMKDVERAGRPEI